MIKRWDDAGYEQKRPDTITVTLLKDGTVYDTRTISRTDSWQYTWSGLPRYNPDGTEIVWTIQENAVPGYISSIRETGDTFILTNTPEGQKLLGSRHPPKVARTSMAPNKNARATTHPRTDDNSGSAVKRPANELRDPVPIATIGRQ